MRGCFAMRGSPLVSGPVRRIGGALYAALEGAGIAAPCAAVNSEWKKIVEKHNRNDEVSHFHRHDAHGFLPLQ